MMKLKIGLAPNPHKQESVQLAGELIGWLEERGIGVAIAEDIATSAGFAHGVSEDEVAASNLLLVLGGDGTMLRWSRLAAPKGTPMLGVNFGQYGFITEIQPEDVKCALERFINNDLCISERVVLKATVTREGKLFGTYFALNDIVVSKGPPARMLALNTYINDRFIVTYRADGIIFSSPTGSTAYSLSAGGPVVHPDVSALIMTPICPHTLNTRALVIPDDEVVRIVGELEAEHPPMMLTADGQICQHLFCSDVVELSKAEFKAKLVQLEPESFYTKLQTRLRWGERFTG